ncbi:MAG: DPP IV N-terminal domain-containing protein, partial [Ginsengibacter sp.]
MRSSIKIIAIVIFSFFCCEINAQPPHGIHWAKDGNSYYEVKDGGIVQNDPASSKSTIIISKEQLIPTGASAPLSVRNFFFSNNGNKILIYTNSKRVWRFDTRGDYWLADLVNHTLKKMGEGRSSSSLMFAKFSPDGKKIAYVSDYNIYVEDLESGKINELTANGTRELINGTFDWAYEEEFFCRDGFRWSPDSKKIAYWQMDAKNTKDYLMIDNTDSIYPFVKPVVYPIAGESPSPFKIGVVTVADASTKWMDIPSDPVLQSYVPRMEWAANSDELIIQHLNRKQNTSDIMLCDVLTGNSKNIYEEKDSAWIDILSLW